MVTRRGFVTAIGGIGSVGAAYAVVTGAPDVDLNVDADVGEFVNDSKSTVADLLVGEPEDPWDQTFNSGIVERIRFEENGTMHVTLTDSHGLDAFGIWHVSDDTDNRRSIASYGTGFMGDSLPRYGGTVSLNLAGELRSEGVEFPSNRFKLVGLTGSMFMWDIEGVVRFRVPADLMP